MNEKNPSNHRLSSSRSYRWVPNSARVHVCMVFTPFLSLKRPLYVWMQTPSFPLEVNPALLGQWEGSHVRVGDLQGQRRDHGGLALAHNHLVDRRVALERALSEFHDELVLPAAELLLRSGSLCAEAPSLSLCGIASR